MVSLFGLKLSSSKKKKSQPAEQKYAPQHKNRIDQNTLGEGQFFGRDHHGASYAVSIYSGSRPGSSHSQYKVKAKSSSSNKNKSNNMDIYGGDVHNLAAASLYDLSNPLSQSRKPSFASIQPPSNPIGMNFNNASAMSLGAPPVLGASRPTTPSRQKAWVNPLDVHFAKGPCPAAVPVRSTFGQGPSGLGLTHAPLMASIVPPSPPQSVKAVDSDSRSLYERPIMPAASRRPSTSRSLRNVPVTGLKESWNAKERAHYAPASIPSPPLSLPSTSDEHEQNPGSLEDLWDERPVIRNVRAKHDTNAMYLPRKVSIKIKLEKPAVPEMPMPSHDQRPKTSSGARDVNDLSSEIPKPLNIGRRGSEAGPTSRSPTAVWNQKRPSGPPTAAAGAYGRPTRPDTRGVHRPAAEEYGAFQRPASDDSAYSTDLVRSNAPADELFLTTNNKTTAHAPVPVPVPVIASQEEEEVPMHRRREPIPDFRFPDWSALAEGDVPDTGAKPIASYNNSPMSNEFTGQWPLQVLKPSSPRIESPVLPPTRAGSPFQMPSFSRPWTPDNKRPSTPIKTTEITITTAMRLAPTPTSSMVPPPRVQADYGTRSPTMRMEFDFGKQFI